MNISFNLDIAFVSSNDRLYKELHEGIEIFRRSDFIKFECCKCLVDAPRKGLDLIIYNYNKGDESCFSFLDLVRAEYPETPIIVLSKDINSDIVRSLYYCGVEEFVCLSDNYSFHLNKAIEYFVLQNKNKLILKKMYRRVILPALTRFNTISQLRSLANFAKSLLYYLF